MGSSFKRLPTISQKWIVLVALFSVTLGSIPTAIKSSSLHIVITVPFVLCVGWAVVRIRSRIDLLVASIVALYGVTILIEVFRGSGLSHAASATLLIASLTAFGATLVASSQSDDERMLRIAAIALAPAVYIAVNVIMQVGHIGPIRFADPGEKALAAGEGASLLKILGFSAQRIQFPLASGINTFGAVGAGGFAAATLLAIYSNAFPKRLTLSLAAVSLYGALATDSRIAILIALVVIALTVLAPRLRAATPSVVLLCLAPWLLIEVLGKLGNSSVLSTLTRHKSSGEFATLNGRLYIWEGAWQVAGKLNSHTLIGWGADGQITSGASRNYARIFQGTPHPIQYTSHNILLQSILDGGYLSLAVYLLAILVVVQCFDRSIRLAPRTPLAALRASLLVIIFAGVTEALPNYNSDDCLAVLLVAFGAAAALKAPAVARSLSRLAIYEHAGRRGLAHDKPGTAAYRSARARRAMALTSK
jgi:hypothetical protein